MKKIIMIFFVLLTNLLIYAQASQPKIVGPKDIFDFGDIYEGKIVSHDFTVYNTGGDTLTITKVRASCGCTAVKPEKNDLLPNDSTSIKVSFNSTRKIGKQHKYVYVFSNDPENPQFRFEFVANVLHKDKAGLNPEPQLKLSVYNHNFGNVSNNKVLDFNVDVLNTGKADLVIKDIKSSCSCTTTMMGTKTIKPNEKSELKIKFDTKNLSGQVARTVTLVSNDPENPMRVLTLIANIEKE